MAPRIQICGRVVAEVADEFIEDRLPGRQGRLLFVYLVVNRLRTATRDELVDALWGDTPPPNVDSALSSLLSKLRRLVELEGRADVRLLLPPDAWVDLEVGTESLHRAEAAVARGAWTDAWGPARVAQHVGQRGFLPGEDVPWVREVRNRLQGMELRALELVAHASLEIGGGELLTAERAARALVDKARFRESGHRFLMQILDRQGNRAEALQVYESLRALLRDELGTPPSDATQALHRELLA